MNSIKLSLIPAKPVVYLSWVLCIISLAQCTSSDAKVYEKILRPDFQEILDDQSVQGSILIFDKKKNTYYSNDFLWARRGDLPASTFKIANTIVGLESNVITGKDHIFQWDGSPRRVEAWEKDLNLKDAFQESCVPCYQQVAENIGVERMRHYLDTLQYPGMQFDSSDINLFWLIGNSRITQFEEILFLKDLHEESLPISSHTYHIIKDIFISDQSPEYIMRAKTGWSIDQGRNNGWYVGYVMYKNSPYYFATNIEPKRAADLDPFISGRKICTYKALQALGIPVVDH